MAKTKAGANAGLGQWCTRLAIKPGIQARSLTIVYLPAVPAFSTKPSICAPFGGYTGFGVSNPIRGNRTSDGSTRRLWYKRLDCSLGFVQSGDNTCLLGEKWFNRLVHSDCGNVICYSIGAYTGGLGDPRVSHAHLVRHTRWQPISDSVSRSTSLLPSVP